MEPLPDAKPPRYRQMRLLTVGNPLTGRLGADFFKNLPRGPGVYLFFDSADRLLYIGQSKDLRARVGSYRHVTPEQNVRRTLRLVHRIARVELQPCETAQAAIALEAALLLERRPPFNRAGVWQGPPWWFSVRAQDGHLEMSLSRQQEEVSHCIGPLPSGFRHTHASLIRSLFRLLYPMATLAAYPVGMLAPTVPLSQRWLTSDAEELAATVHAFVAGTCRTLLARLEALPAPTSMWEQEFWAEDLERLRHKKATLPFSSLPVIVSPSLNFPSRMSKDSGSSTLF